MPRTNEVTNIVSLTRTSRREFMCDLRETRRADLHAQATEMLNEKLYTNKIIESRTSKYKISAMMLLTRP
ncbi:hypothetical protein ALC53_03399 [Atta colombica]|uniref:Uncharacterized protein n=1 Tax=Atta colombica TaxID=520822 RepID=A0A195BN95_9HYME|nr:hypothetical protein ALC53_03399 [Atta colombica]